MIQIHWQDRLLTAKHHVKLTVRRIVFRAVDWPPGAASFVRSLADRAGLEMADEHATPEAGDFWLGCSPRSGWGQIDPDTVGWACSVEVAFALSVLRAACEGQRSQDVSEQTDVLPRKVLAMRN